MNVDEIIEIKNSYLELSRYLDKIVFVKRKSSDVLEIPEMNKWLLEVINFYQKCGIKITYNDFYNFHGNNISEANKRNEKINKYMRVFFDNINDLDSYEFPRVLLGFSDIDISNKNPIYEDILVMINNFNNKHKDIFNKLLLKLGNDYQGLGIDKELFRYDKMDKLKELVDGKVIDCEDMLNELHYLRLYGINKGRK